MTKLKNLKGTAIQFLDADPVVYAGAWSSSGALNTARTGGGLAGSLTAGLYFGGNTPPSSQITETYNGTSWTEVNDMTETARDQMYGFGTQTAAISAAGVTGSTGNKSKLVESWDGTSWTAGTDNNTARQAGGSAGKAQNAGIMYGGMDSTGPGNTANNMTESWNGSSWTELNNLNTAGAYMAGGGTQTSALCGVGGSRPAQNESWNGTSWSEISEQNTYRDQSGGSADSNVSGLIYAGEAPPVTAITESWDGTTWTEVADMGTARSIGSGGTGGQSGGASSALGVGGQIAPGARTGLTEEWSFPPATASALQEGDMWFNSSLSTLKGYAAASGIPAGVWSAGGTMNSGREQGADFGSLSAGVAAGGGGSSVDVEEYNGTSWTEVNNIPAGGASGGATGTQTAGIIYGFKNSSPVRVDVMTYDGTTFTEVNNLNTGRNAGGSAGGVQTAALYAGGGSSDANTEIWNGSTWTEVNDLNDGRYVLKGGGTTTAAVLAGGYGGSPSTNPTQSEQWNGTSWTEGNNLNNGRAYLTGGGSSYSSVMVFGGGPPVTANTEFWNGTTWTEMNNLATASETSHGTTQGTGLGTYRARTPSAAGETEEWTVGAAVVTVTTS